MDKIWIHAEMGGDKPSTITLELATKARSLAGTVEAFYAGDNADAVAQELGQYGVSKVYTVDTGGSLQGVAVASAMAKQIEGGNTPDLIMFGSTYDGRDVLARLSVKLDHPVLTNNIDVSEEGGAVRCTTQIFGGQTIVTTEFKCPAPHLANFRPKSFAAEPGDAKTAEVVAAEAPETGKVRVVERHVEERSGPILDEAPIVVSGGRGLAAQTSTR
jgi:electron transfer flavoprotein alpha subunit